MRKIHLLVSASKGAIPVLLAATVAPMAATCSSTPPTQTAAVSVGAGGNGGAGGTGGEGGTSVGAFVASSASSSSGSGGPAACDPFESPVSFTVEVPPDGTPADPGQICAIAMDPVTSNLAARVTLTKSPMADHLATGFVAIDSALQSEVLGTPTISVMSSDPELNQMQVANILPTAGGFSFDASFPLPFNVRPHSWESMTVKVTMMIRCDPQGITMRMVESITSVHLCTDMKDLLWVSSGSVCNACDIIAEMAPSPIMPDKHGDDLPLGRAMRVRIVPIARIGASVVLFAENDGGVDLAYSWHPSDGKLETIAEDIAIWTPPNDFAPHLMQVVVQGEDTAGVATYAWREAS